MEINVPFDELRKRKIFLATPMYGGVCSGMFAQSVIHLAVKCREIGIGFQLHFLFNESLITRARNYCCDEFLRSDATHMLFIDADIGFNPDDVIMMLAMSIQQPEMNVLGAPYPKKCISWEKVQIAVNKGRGEEDPNELENYIGDYVFNPKNSTSFQIGEPVEVLETGTGFMMFEKNVLEKFNKKFPEYFYKPDHVRTKHFDGTREITQFFQAEIDPKSKRYLSEDYWFCQKLQEIGLTIWLCPWMQTKHVGSYIFGGSLNHLASIGASSTASVEELKKDTI